MTPARSSPQIPAAAASQSRLRLIRGRRRVLVAGGAGFVGSHLCERLLEQDSTVLCLDNLETGSEANIAHLRAHPRFRFLQHDVCDALPVEAAEIDIRGGHIYNLACPASPPHYQRDPVHTTKTSVFGALHLLALAKAQGARILQASTSEVYGDPHIHPQPESYWGHVNSYGPRACYDEGKRCAETLFFDYHARHGVDTRIARIFNTYGPRMSVTDGRVVSNFVVQALRGDDITIYGDGSQTRSFCYVDDLVEGLVRLMASDEAGDAPVNLGNPGEFTMLELADLVIEQTASCSRIVHRTLPIDDPRQRRPDTTRARRVLGWSPRIDLTEGLANTIAYFDDILTGTKERHPAVAAAGRTDEPSYV